MALDRVQLSAGVLLTCNTHALTTEAEEVMGLLLGDVEIQDGLRVANIFAALPQIRTDRRKDRVETSPEQMANCSAIAEELTLTTGVRTRVIGWYHSHPHITVHPSHVDVRTQGIYQMLDSCFVGLIWSVFNTDHSDESHQVQITAFQSIPSTSSPAPDQGRPRTPLDYSQREVPIAISRPAGQLSTQMRDYVSVQQILFEEEKQAYSSAVQGLDGSVASGLRRLHASALHSQVQCEMLEVLLAPAVTALRYRLLQNKLQTAFLQRQNAALQAATGHADLLL